MNTTIASKSDFPQVYKNIDTRDLMSVFNAGPYRLKAVIEGLKEDQLKFRSEEGKWSIIEIVLHLADAEIMAAARIRQTLSQSGREYAYYDQDQWAHSLGYAHAGLSDMEYALTMFTALRMTTSLLLHDTCLEDWEKTGIHAERGLMSLRQNLELYADHSERHIVQILEIRKKLGVPMEDFPILLPERLY